MKVLELSRMGNTLVVNLDLGKGATATINAPIGEVKVTRYGPGPTLDF